jgi:hypothetical protein
MLQLKRCIYLMFMIYYIKLHKYVQRLNLDFTIDVCAKMI